MCESSVDVRDSVAATVPIAVSVRSRHAGLDARRAPRPLERQLQDLLGEASTQSPGGSVPECAHVILESIPCRLDLGGTGEVAEIAFLILQQHGVHIVAVLEESRDGNRLFMNQPVKALEEFLTLSYDWVVIASFKGTRPILQCLARFSQ